VGGVRGGPCYVIALFVARWTSGEAGPSDEVDAVDWIDQPRPDLADDVELERNLYERGADRK